MSDTAIYLILDGSGSMSGTKHEVVQGVNDFIDEQKVDAAKTNDVTILSLTSFDTNVNEVYVQEDISLVNHVSTADTFLGGGTALLDAIGRTLTKAEDNPANKNLVVIYTDGEENSSHEFTKEDIEKLIKKFDATGKWQFIYLGAEFADFQKDQVYTTLSVAGSTGSMNTNKAATRGTFSRMSQGASYYRGTTDAQAQQLKDRGGLIVASTEDAGVDWESVEDKDEQK